jgi:tryptophan-rich sensory protein
MKQKITRFIVSFILCQSAGLVGTFFTVGAIQNWYVFLNKPTFSPPNWLFGPVWTILYTLMAVALFLVWQTGSVNRLTKTAFWIFIVHLVVNALWSILFFGLKSPAWALVDIGLLWIMIVISMFLFYKIRKITFWLLLPYLLWVSFATLLNFYIWKLN